MNKIKTILIAIGCGLLATSTVPAQDTNAPRTRLEAFEAGVGVVIVRGSADVGAVTTATGSVLVRCKESTEASTGHKQQAMAVTLNGKEGQSDTTIIDYDELDSLLHGLDFLANANWSLTALQSFDAVYTTRDGLQAAAYSSQKRSGTLGASLKSNRTTRVRISLSPQELAVFRGLVQQAKSKLEALPGGR